MKTTETDNCCAPDQPCTWTWRDRLRSKLFPFVICHVPEAPPSFQDCIVTKSKSVLSFTDRLRILLTGKVEVEVRIVTEHVVGSIRTNSVLRAGRFWS